MNINNQNFYNHENFKGQNVSLQQKADHLKYSLDQVTKEKEFICKQLDVLSKEVLIFI